MEFAEKLIALRKGRELTQEQLAEQLNVSRQSVSKWESGQVIPEAEKLMELSRVFDVSIDYLLKPSELDELSVKTQILEQQQEKLLIREQKRTCILKSIMYTVIIYLMLLAVYFVEHSLVFTVESELVWGLLGNHVLWAEFFIATAIVILMWARNFRNKE